MRILHTSDWHLGQHFADLILCKTDDTRRALPGRHVSRALLACLGTTVVAAATDPAGQVCVLPRRDGEAGCVVCAIPFIRPRDVLFSQAGQSAEEKQVSLQIAIKTHYQTVFDAASARRSRSSTPWRPTRPSSTR